MSSALRKVASYSLVILVVFTFILVAVLLFKNNKVSQIETEQIIGQLSEKSKYELIQYRKGKAIKLGSGYLGKFYLCLKSYKSSSYKKPRKGKPKSAYYLVLLDAAVFSCCNFDFIKNQLVL